MPFTEQEFAASLGYTPSGGDSAEPFTPSHFFVQRQFADDSTFADGAIDEIIEMTDKVIDVASEYDVETSVFTATEAGLYQFGFHVQAMNSLALLTEGETAGQLVIQLLVAGTAVAQVGVWSHETPAPVLNPAGATIICQVGAGEEVQLNVAGVTSMGFNPSFAAGTCYLWGKRIA